MRRSIENLDLAFLSKTLVLVATLIVAVLIGPLIGWASLGFRELAIFILGLLFTLLIVVPNKQMLKIGLVVLILTFGFGWRTFPVTGSLSVHPSEVIVLLVFFGALAIRIIRRDRLDLAIPVLIPLFMLFAVLGIFTALFRGVPFDRILQEFKIVLIIIPTFYVIKWLITTRAEWERFMLLTIPVAVYVSGLGLMDYFAPGLSRAISGEAFGGIAIAESYGGATFERVGFVFYGNYSAGFLIFTFFGLTAFYFLQSLGKHHLAQFVFGGIMLVELIAMYLSGYRGLWYALGVLILVFAFIQRRGLLLVGAAIASLPVLPANFVERFLSLFDLQYADSSQFRRLERLNEALELMRQSPVLGVGWSGSGYVHSDLAQIGANLGVIALAIFVLWLCTLMWRLFQVTRKSSWTSGYAAAFLATLVGLMVVFAGEGLIVWTQLMAPIWFLIAMGYKLLELDNFATKEIRE